MFTKYMYLYMQTQRLVLQVDPTLIRQEYDAVSSNIQYVHNITLQYPTHRIYVDRKVICHRLANLSVSDRVRLFYFLTHFLTNMVHIIHITVH